MTSKLEIWASKVESTTRKRLGIKTVLDDRNLKKCHPQSQSPLYQIPKEIRDLIFLYASTQSPDPNWKYDPKSYYYRPGHTARLITYTNFLLICRRTWLEANDLPMRQAEHAFWFQRGPYDGEADKRRYLSADREHHRYGKTLRSMTKANLSNVTHIHLFVQMFHAEWLMDRSIMQIFFPEDQIRRGFKPKLFHLTLRHSDWTDWELDRPLYLTDRWVRAILDEPRLGFVEEFQLELEVWDQKKKELERIVERLRNLQGKPKPADPRDPECNAATKFIPKPPPEIWHWSRSPGLENVDWPVYKDITTLDLHVVTLKWCAEPAHISEQHNALPFHNPVEETAFFLTRPMLPASWLTNATLPGGAHGVSLITSPKADAVEQARRQIFESLMGELAAEKMIGEWEAQGLLLKLESDDVDVVGRAYARATRHLLNIFGP